MDNSEVMVRRAFAHYETAGGTRGYLGRDDLPALLQDLGLHLDRTDRDVVDKLYENDFSQSKSTHEDRLSFHDFVRFKNKFMALQAPKQLGRSASSPSLSATHTSFRSTM